MAEESEMAEGAAVLEVSEVGEEFRWRNAITLSLQRRW